MFDGTADGVMTLSVVSFLLFEWSELPCVLLASSVSVLALTGPSAFDLLLGILDGLGV